MVRRNEGKSNGKRPADIEGSLISQQNDKGDSSQSKNSPKIMQKFGKYGTAKKLVNHEIPELPTSLSEDSTYKEQDAALGATLNHKSPPNTHALVTPEDTMGSPRITELEPVSLTVMSQVSAPAMRAGSRSEATGMLDTGMLE